MIYPEGDAIKDRIRNRYSLVVLAAKRARQLKEGAPALIETSSANALTVALEEIAAGKINFIEGVEHRRDDESPSHEADPAAQLEDAFPAPADTRPAAPAISQELAAFMESPTDTVSEDEIETDDEDGSDGDADSDDEDESAESNEETEA